MHIDGRLLLPEVVRAARGDRYSAEYMRRVALVFSHGTVYDTLVSCSALSQ
jgi:hypothetical protein